MSEAAGPLSVVYMPDCLQERTPWFRAVRFRGPVAFCVSTGKRQPWSRSFSRWNQSDSIQKAPGPGSGPSEVSLWTAAPLASLKNSSLRRAHGPVPVRMGQS